MNILQNLYIKLTSKYIGCDKDSNQYYESRKKDYLGRNKRYVIYNQFTGFKNIPPSCHAWLHHLSDAFKEKNDSYGGNYKNNYIINRSGDYHRRDVSSDYNPWNGNIN